MATCKLQTVVSQIKKTEGFDIVVLTSDGRKVRKDRTGFHRYAFDRRAKDAYTVSEWKKVRFSSQLAGYECDVLDGQGSPAPGHMTLKTLRATY